MERREKELRQSSLPSSLIPHLYSGPRDALGAGSTIPAPALRAEEVTELPSIHSVPAGYTLRPASPRSSSWFNDIHLNLRRYSTYDSRTIEQTNHDPSLGTAISDPGRVPSPFSPPVSEHYTSFSDPRNYQSSKGPSYVNPDQHDQGTSQGRRGSSQPAQSGPQSEVSTRGGQSEGEGHSRRGTFLREVEMEGQTDVGTPLQPVDSHGSWPSVSSQGMSLKNVTHQPDLPKHYPHGGQNRSWPSEATQSSAGGSEIGPIYSSSTISRMSSDAKHEGGDDDEVKVPQRGKKRRRDSDEGGDTSRKSRKTAVACNFCRGRKLRCNGVKPACSNCTVRKFECEYVPVQRRRGPGKAPKGTKSKKGGSNAGRLEPSTSLAPNDRSTGAGPDTLGPDLAAHTSVMSLSSFSFQAPEGSPPYPSASASASASQSRPRRRRGYGSRLTSSSEQGSDADYSGSR